MDTSSLTPAVRNSCGRVFRRHRWGEWVAAPIVTAEERRCARCGQAQFRIVLA